MRFYPSFESQICVVGFKYSCIYQLQIQCECHSIRVYHFVHTRTPNNEIWDPCRTTTKIKFPESFCLVSLHELFYQNDVDIVFNIMQSQLLIYDEPIVCFVCPLCHLINHNVCEISMDKTVRPSVHPNGNKISDFTFQSFPVYLLPVCDQ